tara:strand:- start:2946 stop:4028 length:1083 start_codon:yes stop_codon:yes gene_type:complete
MGPYLKSFLPFAQKRLGFNRPPTIFFDSDPDNSKKVLGKTAHYDPEALEVVVYIDKRHPKDILRSLSHELVHHSQNCRGDLEPEIAGETGPGYAQTNPHMRQMESEAFEKGNLCMRDWEDKVKIQLSMQVELQETNYLHITGDSHKMATYEQLKEQITQKVVEALTEKLKMVKGPDGKMVPDYAVDGKGAGDLKKEEQEELEEGEAFAPNHYCVHHGGVQHEGKIHMAEAVGHNWSEESQRVTHYDMKLEDGSVLKNVAFEDIQVTEASLAKEHHHTMKRDDEKDKDKGPDKELEERKKRNDPRNDRGIPQRMKMNEVELDEEEEAVNEEENETDVNLNESNDHWYQKQLFEKLSKRWTK